MKQYIVDAFAETLFTGNPAAVLPCETMPTAACMQQIAIENNYSETAFVVKTGDGRYDLKWFTPGGEIDLCGHATLATAYVINRFADPGTEEMRFQTLSGELKATKEGALFTLDFPVGKVKPVPVTEDMRRATDGMAKEAFFDGGDLVVLIEDEEKLRLFVPDDERIEKLEGLGLVLSAPSARYDFVSRCFYPKLHVSEDPVTGRAHTFLAPIWAQKLEKDVMRAKQLSKRTGVVTVRLLGDRVYLSGKVQLFMQGEIADDALAYPEAIAHRS
ncbi:MAG: PhzF family phenazine biosynthesis protein [Eubacteriales bacterium]|nr:PhzF family phenazine biosynthesis protein [Eubacteriales bacterium]